MSLETEINEGSQEISTDAYGMSVGELVSLYKEGEVDIHPEFQRFFRWTIEQKSRFIESLLLGIPIPSIFVSQTEKGAWDVVDGLQRISTILELMGELKDQNEDKLPPLTLTATKHLPSLAGKKWESSEKSEDLGQLAKLKIKRSRLDLKIVLNTSDPKSKYELFERLNTGGSLATDQEVRNCILIMINKEFYKWLDELRLDENFQRCIPLSDRQLSEQFDMELVVRFIVLWNLDNQTLNSITEVGRFLTDQIVNIAENTKYDRGLSEKAFRETFKTLASTLGEDSFKKFDIKKNRFSGAVSISMFEISALGIAYNIIYDTFSKNRDDLVNVSKSLWDNPSFVSGTGSGIRASTRIPITIPMGRSAYKS